MTIRRKRRVKPDLNARKAAGPSRAISGVRHVLTRGLSSWQGTFRLAALLGIAIVTSLGSVWLFDLRVELGLIYICRA